ncbi:MAG TPA: hypothetical protein VLK33_04540 [Terriglobales bacterium]|nr:hypothetical protein [Terriglobales bacterium]
MNKSVFAVCIFLVALSVYAADTKPVKNPEGNCSVSVPANWTAGSLGNATSPDKKMSIIVSSPKRGLVSITQVQQMAPGIYPDDKVTKSSATEFEMEGKSTSGKPNVYRAVPAGARVCIAEITYENDKTADARTVVGSLKAEK